MIFCYTVIANVHNLDRVIVPDDEAISEHTLKGAFFTVNIAMRQPVESANQLLEAALRDWQRRHPHYTKGLGPSDLTIDSFFEISLLDYVWQRVRGKYRGGTTFYRND